MKVILLGVLFVAIIICVTPQIHAQDRNINKAVGKCEGAVAKNCVESGTCSKFCKAAYQRSPSGKNRCLQECTVDKRCKAKGRGLKFEFSGNEELDTWTADQLAQCIAEERDPDNKTTGRRKIHWKDIITPSLAKLLKVASPDKVIDKAVKKCESEVAKNCVESGTCAKFCEAAYIRSKSGKARCLQECTVEKRCKAKGPGKQSGTLVITGNRELDTWTADQLAQCIAQERDPDNKTTGRREIAWKEIVTPSLAKLLNVPVKINKNKSFQIQLTVCLCL